MFFIVCASTSNSSVRVGCPSAVEAFAKVRELEDTGVGKVRVFDDRGKRFSIEEIASLASDAVEPMSPSAGAGAS